MKLYSSPGACSTSCHIAFEEGKIPFEPMVGKPDEVEKLNPQGAVPVLVMEDGSVLTQNIAILTFAAHRAPQLLPKAGTPEFFQAYRWLAWTSSDLHPEFGPLFSDSLPEADRKAGEAAIHGLLAIVNQHLKGRQFLAGDQFSIADALFFVVSSWAPHLGVSLKEFPEITAFQARIAQRPAVQTVLKREGLIE